MLRRLTPLLVVLLVAAGAARAQFPDQRGPIAPSDTLTAGFVGLATSGPYDTPTAVTSYAGFTSVFGSSTAGLANPYLAPSVAAFFANGGGTAVIVRAVSDAPGDLIGHDSPTGPPRTGLWALTGLTDVSVVAMPGVTDEFVQDALIEHCRREGDRIAILDSAAPTGVAAVQAQRAGLVSDEGYGALYFPWIEAAPTGTTLLLPPSGFVAGLYCATSPSDSPVGVLATASAVAEDIDAATNDVLNTQNINCIRDLSGIRVWGARTLGSDPEWRYVATRRTALHIARSVEHGTSWAVFENNDAVLWSALAGDVEDFLYGLYRGGYFAGATVNEAYFVDCGLGSTMTEQDIAEGRVKIRVGFAPLRPAEFVVLEIEHRLQGAADAPDRIPTAPGVSLAAPAPNPCNPRTVIRYAVAAAGPVGVEIVDVAGRRVRTLVPTGWHDTGAHALPWDGKDDAGRGVASGVYLVRVVGREGVPPRPVTLVR